LGKSGQNVLFNFGKIFNVNYKIPVLAMLGIFLFFSLVGSNQDAFAFHIPIGSKCDTSFIGNPPKNGVDYSGCQFHDGKLFFGDTLTNANFKGATLKKATFPFSNLEGADFRDGADVSGSVFSTLNLKNTKWQGVTAENTKFLDATLTDAKFNNAKLTGAFFNGANLQGADFREATAGKNDQNDGVQFPGAGIRGADFRGVEFEGLVNFFGCDAEPSVARTNFKDTTISGNFIACDLSFAIFEGADLRGSLFNIDHPQFFGISLTTVLRGTNFIEATLTDINFRFTIAPNAIFRGAHLEGANFDGSLLNGAVFTDAHLKNSIFRCFTGFFGPFPAGGPVRLENADFRGADLDNASFGLFNLDVPDDPSLWQVGICDKELDGPAASNDVSASTHEGVPHTAQELVCNAKGIKFGPGPGTNGPDAFKEGVSGPNIDINGCNFENASFRFADFSGSISGSSSFDFNVLSGADLNCKGFSFCIDDVPPFLLQKDKTSVLPTCVLTSSCRVEGNTIGGAFVDYSTATEDFRDGPDNAICDPLPGEFFFLGEHKEVCEATDAAGNSKKSLAITVVDTTPPTITIDDVIIQACFYPTTPLDRIDLGMPTVIDIVDPNPLVEIMAPSEFRLGETLVTWTATDKSRNSASVTQKVTLVIDDEDGDGIVKCVDTIPEELKIHQTTARLMVP